MGQLTDVRLLLPFIALCMIDGALSACQTDIADTSSFEYDTRCFYIVSKSFSNWLEAEKHCQSQLSGHMAMPESQALLDMIGSGSYYIGHNILDSEYLCNDTASCLPHWTYPNGTTIDIFSPGQPDNRNNQGQMCMVLKHGQLQDRICDESFGAICEGDAFLGDCQSGVQLQVCNGDHFQYATTGPPYARSTRMSFGCGTSTIEAECVGPPYGWYYFRPPYVTCGKCDVVEYDGRCFYIVWKNAIEDSWIAAETFCQNTVNGHLAYPESVGLLEAISEKANFTTQYFFIGSNIRSKDYKCNSRDTCSPFWKFPNETNIPLNLFTSQDPGNQGAGNQHCTVLRPDMKLLGDYKCFSDRGAICEVDAAAKYPAGCTSGPIVEGPYVYSTPYSNASAEQPYPPGTIATITCSVLPLCDREFQAECIGGRFQWYFKDYHPFLCTPCENCTVPPPEPPACARRIGDNHGLQYHHHSSTASYECYGSLQYVAEATCNAGVWDFPGCPELNGTLEFERKCYFVTLEEQHSWIDAEKNCQAKFNGDLAFPESKEQLKAIYDTVSPTFPTFLHMAPHVTDVEYDCQSSTECISYWTYSNSSTIPLTLYNSAEDEPKQNRCNRLQLTSAKQQTMATGSCDAQLGYVCEINTRADFASECSSPPNELVCNSSQFIFDHSGFPYPNGTTATLVCSSGEVKAECLGQPLNWFFLDNSLEACGICEQGDCVTPPPHLPCGFPSQALHPVPFKDGERVNYTCPVNAATNAEMVCTNGTWAGKCADDENVEYDCQSSTECISYWMYLNSSTIPLTLYNSAEDEPKQNRCNRLQLTSAEEQTMATGSCDVQLGYVCEINARDDFASECSSPPNELVCNSSQFIFDHSDFPYPNGTTATLVCSSGEVKAECLGQPLNWFFLDNSLEACGICELGDCVTPPPHLPCGFPSEALHPVPFKDGERVNYTCPVNAATNAEMVCTNGTWAGKCPDDEIRQMTVSEMLPVNRGPLSYPAPPVDGHFLLGTQITWKADAYNCSSSDCDSLWFDENNQSLAENVTGARNDKKCLAQNQQGLIAVDCTTSNFALCKVLTGVTDHVCSTPLIPAGCTPTFDQNSDSQGAYPSGTTMTLNCLCTPSCRVLVNATCYGHPVNWFYRMYPTSICESIFEFEGQCYLLPSLEHDLQNATAYCRNEVQGYVPPAIASPVFIQKIQERILAKGMDEQISVLFSTHLTYNESAYLCATTDDCNALWLDESGQPLTQVETTPGDGPDKCLGLNVTTGVYRNQLCTSARYFLCRIQPMDAKFATESTTEETVTDSTTVHTTTLEATTLDTTTLETTTLETTISESAEWTSRMTDANSESTTVADTTRSGGSPSPSTADTALDSSTPPTTFAMSASSEDKRSSVTVETRTTGNASSTERLTEITTQPSEEKPHVCRPRNEVDAPTETPFGFGPPTFPIALARTLEQRGRHSCFGFYWLSILNRRIQHIRNAEDRVPVVLFDEVVLVLVLGPLLFYGLALPTQMLERVAMKEIIMCPREPTSVLLLQSAPLRTGELLRHSRRDGQSQCRFYLVFKLFVDVGLVFDRVRWILELHTDCVDLSFSAGFQLMPLDSLVVLLHGFHQKLPLPRKLNQ
ncbi:unnamed protein product [Cyprideis torosa]|uniref:Uncharacterized protein n=1 Tax=Cyprideis torosa TaxID=163714 RepID=A0A7R8ZNL1_9CRUS|nr:unnamed protein product [Cyprideis torosa]CAG0891847.1 unnamed protein product [Cyprideis torosa]